MYSLSSVYSYYVCIAKTYYIIVLSYTSVHDAIISYLTELRQSVL